MKKNWFVLTFLFLVLAMFVVDIVGGLPRYPVGQPVASSVYTEPFDPCDPAYKFLVPPPKDWSEKFGKNERTMLIHSISELRVVVANLSKLVTEQGKTIQALEDFNKKYFDFSGWDPNQGPVFRYDKDPNSPERLIKFQYSTDKPQFKDPNLAPQGEAKR